MVQTKIEKCVNVKNILKLFLRNSAYKINLHPDIGYFCFFNKANWYTKSL